MVWFGVPRSSPPKPRERRRPSAATARIGSREASDSRRPRRVAGTAENAPSSACPSFAIACSVLARLRPRPRRRAPIQSGKLCGERVRAVPLVTAGERFRSARLRGAEAGGITPARDRPPTCGRTRPRPTSSSCVPCSSTRPSPTTRTIESARARWPACAPPSPRSCASPAGWRWRHAASSFSSSEAVASSSSTMGASRRMARAMDRRCARRPTAGRRSPDARGVAFRAGRTNPSAFARRHASRTSSSVAPGRAADVVHHRIVEQEHVLIDDGHARQHAFRRVGRGVAPPMRRAARGPVVLGDEVERRGLPHPSRHERGQLAVFARQAQPSNTGSPCSRPNPSANSMRDPSPAARRSCPPPPARPPPGCGASRS